MKLSRLALAVLAVAFSIGAAQAITVHRSVTVKGSRWWVWLDIGGFCEIKDWHPAIGTCIEEGPQTRTLVTRDGKATFVETQTARNDAEHQYSYTFKSSPLPVTAYASTIKVVPKSNGVSTVIWSSTYVPDPGKEHDAREALTGIYEAKSDGEPGVPADHQIGDNGCDHYAS